MIKFLNTISHEAKKEMLQLESLLNKEKLEWFYFVPNSKKCLSYIEKCVIDRFHVQRKSIEIFEMIASLYKKTNFKNSLYKIIVIRNIPMRFWSPTTDANKQICLLWIYYYQNHIKIMRVDSFGNQRIVNLLKILEINNFCEFNRFYKKLCSIDLERIKKFELALDSLKIKWNLITSEELYDEDMIDSDGSFADKSFIKNRMVAIYVIEAKEFKHYHFKEMPTHGQRELFFLEKRKGLKVDFVSSMGRYVDENFSKLKREIGLKMNEK